MDGSTSNGIFHFEVEDRQVLGFDTGLSPQAFAKARLGNLLTLGGIIVDSTIHGWNLEGTTEYQGHMIFYGENFAGESLETLLSRSKDMALLALQWYLRALNIIAVSQESLLDIICLFPAGVFVGPNGSVLFTPAALVKRVYEYQDPLGYIDKILQWIHPDKSGVEAAVFTAATLSYRLCTGTGPFVVSNTSVPERNRDGLVQNIRDGLFKSTRLVVPKLLPEIALCIDTILRSATEKPQGYLEKLIQYIGDPGKKKITDLYTEEEIPNAALEVEQRNYHRYSRRIIVQRFFKKYKYAMIAGLGTALALLLIIRSIVTEQKKRPSTRGLSPLEVAETYYKAFNTLDHQWMEACVHKGVGRGDIEAVMNLFVISRVREAYERKVTVLDPETWKSQGAPATEATIFGITDLKLELKTVISPPPDSGNRCEVEATYSFYYPEQSASDQTKTPFVEQRRDLLTLEWETDRWEILSIDRHVFNDQSDIP